MICLAGGYFSPLSQKLIRGENPTALGDRLQGIFAAENFFIDLQRHKDPEEERLNRKLKAFAEQIHAPLVDFDAGGAHADRGTVVGSVPAEDTRAILGSTTS